MESTKAVQKKTWFDYVFCLVVGSLYLFAINRAIITSTFISVGPGEMFIFGTASIIIFLVILHNKVTRIATLAILIVASIFILFTLYDIYYQHPHFYDLYLMITGRIPYRSDLGVTIVWIVSLVLGFTVVVFMFHSFSFYVLAAGGIAAVGITWIAGFSRDEMSFLIFLLCFLLILIRKTNKHMVLAAAPLCLVLIIFFQSSMPAYSDFFTARRLRQVVDGPVSAIGDFFFELFTPTYFSFHTTGFSGAGGLLGGPVTPNNRSVMTVQAPGRTYLAGAISNTYTGDRWISTLTHGDINTHGLTPSHFEMLETAAALMRSATHMTANSNLATLGGMGLPISDQLNMNVRDFTTLGAAHRNFRGTYYLHSYLPLEIMTISVGTNRTGTVFRPNFMSLLWFYDGGPNYAPDSTVSPTGDIRAPGFMSRGTAYHMQFLNVNTQLSFVDYILRQAKQGVYAMRGTDEWRNPRPTLGANESFETSPIIGIFGDRLNDFTVLETDVFGVAQMVALVDIFIREDVSGRGRHAHNYIYTGGQLIEWLDIFSAEVLAPYAQQVRENFLQVPEITPQRVWDLTEQIVYGRTSDFERVMAIRDYLLQFPYNLNTVPVPRGVCFVDHFLFYGQQGYCTYFASAMAVMARMAGIPSRYVEGFIVPPVADNAPIAVTNRMAHAWVEVYLEGFGWHIVEATPTYAFLMDTDIVIPPTGGLAPDFFDPAWVEMMADWEMEMYYWEAAMRMGNPIGGGGGTGGVGGIDVEYDEGFRPTPRFISLVMLTLIALAIIVFLLFIIGRSWLIAYKIRRVKNLLPNHQIQVYFKGILEIVSVHSKPVAYGETPQAYGSHMGKRFAFRSDSIFFRDLIALYYKAQYSPHQATEYEVALMEEAYHDMVRLLEMTRRRPKFIYLRYVKQVGAL